MLFVLSLAAGSNPNLRGCFDKVSIISTPQRARFTFLFNWKLPFIYLFFLKMVKRTHKTKRRNKLILLRIFRTSGIPQKWCFFCSFLQQRQSVGTFPAGGSIVTARQWRHQTAATTGVEGGGGTIYCACAKQRSMSSPLAPPLVTRLMNTCFYGTRVNRNVYFILFILFNVSTEGVQFGRAPGRICPWSFFNEALSTSEALHGINPIQQRSAVESLACDDFVRECTWKCLAVEGTR